MKAVLLAAGEGARLRPLTEALPKCMMPILGIPLLELWLQALVKLGVREVLINTSYMYELVESFVKKQKRPLKLHLVREDGLLGTAGTLFANKKFLIGSDVLVVHADNLSLFNPTRFSLAFQERPKSAVATAMTFETDSPETCGIVATDKNGIIQKLFEKVSNPPGTRANAAVYIFSREFMNEIFNGDDLEDISTQILPKLLGRMNEYFNDKYHRDVGSLSLFRKCCDEALKHLDLFDGPTSPIWTELADESSWVDWQKAWKKTGLRTKVCLSVEDAAPEGHEVVLIESCNSKDLAKLSTLAAKSPGVTFVPWKKVAGA